MPAPLALIGGTLLRSAATAGARTAIAGGTRAAIGQSVKGAIKNTIKEKAIGAVKDKFLRSKNKKISKEKLLGDTETGLVKYSGPPNSDGGKGSSIIKRPGFGLIAQNDSLKQEDSEDQKKSFESILKVLDDIKSSLKNIESLINSELKNISDRIKQQSILSFKRKSEEKESRLEARKKGDGDGEKKEKDKLETPSLFDRIWNYLSNILAGSLLNWALNYLPEITSAFNSVIDAFQNPLKRLKFSIITLTTVFPRFVKRVFNFGKKIFVGPAKFIGKLIFKAASLVKNLFDKAGKAIFNLIKEPLKRLLGPTATSILKGIGKGVGSIVKGGVKGTLSRAAAKIGGKGAAKVVSKTTDTIAKTAPAVFKRLKIFSKVLKRVPIIGALIGIGIDLAMGEPLDRALVGAAGSSLGAALGALIGQGVIPIPVFGAAVGGFVGSAVGDWAAKSFYDYLKGRTEEAESEVKGDTKVQSKAMGGTVNNTQRATRQTSVRKRTFVERRVQRIPKHEKSSPIPENIVKYSRENIFKGENSTKRFLRISDAFRRLSFIGEIMNLGISIGMGKRISDNDASIAASQIANSIGNAIKTKKIKEIDPKLAEVISVGLNKWARQTILSELRKKQSYFNVKESDKDNGIFGFGSSSSSSQSGVDRWNRQRRSRSGRNRNRGRDDRESTSIVTGGDADFWILAAVASLESGNPQGQADVAQSIYNRVASRSNFGQSSHTIKGHIIARNQYQPVRETRGGYETWSRIVDKRTAIEALSNHPRGANAARMIEQAAANITNPELQRNAAEWVGGRTDFATPGAANRYPGGIGFKTRHGHLFGWYVGPGSIAYGKTNPGPALVPQLGDVRVMTPTAPTLPPPPNGSNPPSTPTQTNTRTRVRRSRQNPTGRKNKTIYLHWNAGSPSSAPSNYHTSILGDGTIRRVTPYDNHSVSHTYKRNSNAIGISVSGMSGASPDNFGRYPIKSIQYEKMSEEVARVAKAWGWKPSDITLRNVMTHSEAGSNKDGRTPHENYGPVLWGGSGVKWDLFKLYQNDPDGSGGDKIRSMIRAKMSGGNLEDLEPSDSTLSPGDPPAEYNDSPDINQDPTDSSSSEPELRPFDKSVLWAVRGDPSNPRNKGFKPLNQSGNKPNEGGKGGGDGFSRPRSFNRNIFSGLNNTLNNNSTKNKSEFYKDNQNILNVFSNTPNVNIAPLNVKASYEDSQSTIIMMMPLPSQKNVSSSDISMQSMRNGGVLPVVINSSSNYYKQILTRALY